MSLLKRLRELGPGALVAAAFIGPGTVTVCTLAGANYGYALLWALLFATLATIVFQEMAARLGTVAQRGLGEALRETLEHSAWKWPMMGVIIVALYAGNAAYEAGNLSGAALGVEAISGSDVLGPAVVALSLIAAIILWHGSYKLIERFLIALVVLMATSFIATFFLSKPLVGEMFRGLFIPVLPEGSLLTVVALIGTTVVPYNLFLHASAAKERWQDGSDLSKARTDTVISIGLGGLVAILIVSTASAGLFAQGLTANSAGEMAVQLEPLFGSTAKYFLGVGLLAAGLSSSLTAPIATAYALSEIFPQQKYSKTTVFRAVSLSVLAVGALFALSGIRPLSIIVAAQFANGLLLPVVAAFLLYAMNQRSILGAYANGWVTNLLGASAFLVFLGLGIRLILRSASLL